MPKPLVDQLGPDTIARFVKSAPLRIEEGAALSEKHRLASIYLLGYAAEMLLKAAYFKNIGFHAIEEIDRDARNRAMSVAQLNHLMSREPHDILGWARLLVWDKETLHKPAYETGFGRQIIAKAHVIDENWRPQMRYRNTTPHPNTLTTVRAAVDWLDKNHHRM